MLSRPLSLLLAALIEPYLSNNLRSIIEYDKEGYFLADVINLLTMQTILNNLKLKSTDFSLIEILYDRKVNESIDYLISAHKSIKESTALVRV